MLYNVHMHIMYYVISYSLYSLYDVHYTAYSVRHILYDEHHAAYNNTTAKTLVNCIDVSYYL